LRCESRLACHTQEEIAEKMSKERLSKLQKWILKRCLKRVLFERQEARLFYGKKFSPGGYEKKAFNVYKSYTPKKELRSTRAIEASISRSLTNLLGRGLLGYDPMTGYYLTEKAFLALAERRISSNDNFKEYKAKVDLIAGQWRKRTEQCLDEVSDFPKS